MVRDKDPQAVQGGRVRGDSGVQLSHVGSTPHLPPALPSP